ncbi:MAG: flavodoxin family protein [Bacillota bacterium]|jgi:hypothetical protein
MKAVVLNGARGEDACLTGVLAVLVESLKAPGHDVDVLDLDGMSVADCRGCFGCWVKTPGVCVIHDDGLEALRAVAQCDILVFLSPVTFGGYSSVLKKGVDRLIGNILPYFVKAGSEIHHAPRYHRCLGLAAMGVQDSPCEEEARIFRALVSRNAINLQAAGHSSVVVTRDAPEAAVALAIRYMLEEAGAEG